MAILKGGLFEDVNGKLGNLVVRKVKGKSVVAVRPLTYKKTKSRKAILVRSRFTIAVEFSKFINSIPILKSAWANADIKGSSAFNMIEKYNLRLVNDNAPSLQNIITPPLSINKNICIYPLDELIFNGDTITINFKDVNGSALSAGTGKYTFVFVLLFFEPKRKEERYFVMDEIISPAFNITSVGKGITIPINPIIRNKISHYTKLIIYSASIMPGTAKITYYSSITFSKEFDLTSNFK